MAEMTATHSYLKECQRVAQQGGYLGCYSTSNRDEVITRILETIDIRRIVELCCQYPEYGMHDLKARLCDFYGQSSIVLGSGVDGLIVEVNRTLVIGTSAVVCPSFYRIVQTLRDPLMCRLPFGWGNELMPIEPLREWLHRHRVQAIWIANPNPITGQILRAQDLYDLFIEFGDILFIIDESGVEFAPDVPPASVIGYAERLPNLVVLRSFSKYFGLPGLRLGTLFASDGLVRILESSLSVFPVSAVAYALVDAMLGSLDQLALMRSRVSRLREEILALCEGSEVEVARSASHVLIARHKHEDTSTSFRRQGVLPYPLGHEFGTDFHNCVRIGLVSGRAERPRILKAFSDIIGDSRADCVG